MPPTPGEHDAPEDDEFSGLTGDDDASVDESFDGMLRALAAPPGGRGAAVAMIGQVVGGKYRLQRLIGQGGMGDVFEATGPGGEVVAVKVMSAAFGQSAERRGRFGRELRAAMAIRSLHIVRVIDADGSPAQGPPYLAMERLQGLDLRASLQARGPLAPGAARELFVQACEGLSAAHGHGIIHRDIKPENLFLHEPPGGDVTLKICDFGIAKRLDLLPAGFDLTTLTRQGDVIGTLVYMSPEQLKNARGVDHRADLWGLCASLHEALSGKKPWGGARAVGEMVVAVATWRLRPLREVAPHVPPALAAVVDRGMQRDPADRWQSAGELASALRSLRLE